MHTEKMTIRVPGKLMIAGEFAVLEPDVHCLVMAVDRYIFAEIQASDENRVSLLDFGLNDITFSWENGNIVLHIEDMRKKFVEQAMTIAYRYLDEKGVSLPPVRLSIRSELKDESGVKYGLGSSAAVTTAAVTAILNYFLKEEADKELIFKLASLTHVIIQGNGSGADIAASCFGGLIQYSSFQAEWLLKAWSDSKSIHDLIEKNWLYLSIKPIPIPNNILFCVGWTKKAASTGKLVDQVLKLKKANPERFALFLYQSRNAVKKMADGVRQGNLPLLMEGTKENRKALARLGKDAGADIETPLLKTLSDIAEKYGGAGKPSGAGGGDCGISFMPSKEAQENLYKAWMQEGIRPLSLQPDIRGVCVINDEIK